LLCADDVPQHFAYITPSKRKAAVDDGNHSDGSSSDFDATIPMVQVDGLKGIWEPLTLPNHLTELSTYIKLP
jgi:hypothetical protein